MLCENGICNQINLSFPRLVIKGNGLDGGNYDRVIARTC